MLSNNNLYCYRFLPKTCNENSSYFYECFSKDFNLLSPTVNVAKAILINEISKMLSDSYQNLAKTLKRIDRVSFL